MNLLKRHPSRLKDLSLTTLYTLVAQRLNHLESTTAEFVELPPHQLTTVQNYLGNMPDDIYAEFFDGVVSETRNLNGKGSYLESVVVAKRAKRFHYEGGMFDLMRTISIVTCCLPAMKKLEDFKFHINWLPHESIEFVQDSFVSAIQSLRHLQRVDILGFDLPIGLLASSLSLNCSQSLKEFRFQDLDDGIQALGIGDGVYESLAACGKLQELDLKGIADSKGFYDQFLSAEGAQENLVKLGVTLGSVHRGKTLKKWVLNSGAILKRLGSITVTWHVAPFVDELSRAMPSLNDITVLIREGVPEAAGTFPFSDARIDLSWVASFKNTRRVSVAFIQPIPWSRIVLASLFQANLSTLRLRGVLDIDLDEILPLCEILQHLQFDDCSFLPLKTCNNDHRQGIPSLNDRQNQVSPKIISLRVSNQQQDVSSSSFEAYKALIMSCCNSLQSLSLAIPVSDRHVKEIFDREVCKNLKKSGLQRLLVESRNLMAASVDLLLHALYSPSLSKIDVSANFSDQDIERLMKMVKNTSLERSVFSRYF